MAPHRLGAAVFGPDRLAYWQAALESSSKAKAASPGAERAEEVEAEIGELERRIERQVLSLEADDVTPALRRRVAERVAELEATIDERRGVLARLRQQAPGEGRTFHDVEAALSRLPVIVEDLASKPQPVLRQLFRQPEPLRYLPSAASAAGHRGDPVAQRPKIGG